ncbi:hypothetical protein MMC21_000465 [Puttea exsequens]|nr:hypothetical protein [Puttea exsequens]
MKLLTSLLWLSSALETFTVSAQALIYTSDTILPPPEAEPPSISPHTARLLFAQRLGLSQYHRLEDADDSMLDVLNTYGRSRQQVFTHDEDTREKENVLIFVDGVSRPEDILDAAVVPALTIDSPPSSQQNLQLTLDLLEQDKYLRSQNRPHCSVEFPPSSLFRGGLSTLQEDDHGCGVREKLLTNVVENKRPQTEQLGTCNDFRVTMGSGGHPQTTILHVSSLQGLTPKDAQYTTAAAALKFFLSSFPLTASTTTTTTIILNPPSSHQHKRTTTSPYGTYLLPRQLPSQKEEPLEATASTAPTHAPSTPNPAPLPHGIIPICHPNLEAANAATNNCSGHGTAYKKSGGAIDCFACKCSKTVLTDDEGKVKTMYWGGAACQKKDVSAPFFLLAGLTIALVGVVSWGIGLLMSVGQEELPSVIGAGVAGPRAQK